MTILLTQAIQVAGVTQPAGTTLTLEAGLEADLVTRKCATFVSRPDQGITAEVFARTDPAHRGLDFGNWRREVKYISRQGTRPDTDVLRRFFVRAGTLWRLFRWPQGSLDTQHSNAGPNSWRMCNTVMLDQTNGPPLVAISESRHRRKTSFQSWIPR